MASCITQTNSKLCGWESMAMGHLGVSVLTGFLVVLLIVTILHRTDSDVNNHDVLTCLTEDEYVTVMINRKLKEEGYKIETITNKRFLTNFMLEDYPRIDPVPSSKAAIHNGPIEHGTPLMPYIPQPTPPSIPSPRPGLP
ncbi:hypothetical protein J5N97_015684 [Dioscorea zingiberensis]|uniref:Uncharacterized protein n=1 Tax=Dioscorea zingiberensis TaxID=325984 RepID=A0A9D5CIU0_9LILI|nr:hypothetical protein J5N97_015684 [Dioscorea zingiberensis]